MVMPQFEVKRRFGGHGGVPCEWEFTTTNALDGFAQFAQLVEAEWLKPHVACTIPTHRDVYRAQSFVLRQGTPRAIVERVIAELLSGAWE